MQPAAIYFDTDGNVSAYAAPGSACVMLDNDPAPTVPINVNGRAVYLDLSKALVGQIQDPAIAAAVQARIDEAETYLAALAVPPVAGD